MAKTPAKTADKTAKPVDPNVQATVALRTLVVFSALMVIVPSVLFLASSHGYFDVLFRLTVGVPAAEHKTIASAIFAILGVNLVVALFVYHAFKEVDAQDLKPKFE